MEETLRTPQQVLLRAWNAPLEGRTWKDKRELLIAHGIRQFHRKGVNGTGVAEVLAAANMGKSQFYHYFENKDDFVCAVVECEMDFFLKRVLPEAHTLRTLANFSDWFQPYLALADLPGYLGCPVGVIASEMSISTPPVREAAARCLQRWTDAMTAGFGYLKSHAPLRAEFDPQSAAEFMAASVQGALLLGRAFQTNRPILQARDNLQAYLESFRP